MPITCPNCQLADSSLDISKSIELPPDSLFDEITLQVVECTNCNFSGLAVYEESRRGSLDDETTNHYGYRIKEKVLNEIGDMINRCPEPSNWQCNCVVHKDLGATNHRGRWAGIEKIKKGAKFTL